MSGKRESGGGALVGIFVGGRSSRMGGAAKGLLPAPNQEKTLLERLVVEARAALPEAEVVLVGKQPAYADVPLSLIEDARAGQGPLGGLVALLAAAEARDCEHVYALACDLPYLSRTSIAKLAAHSATSSAVAPRRGDIWEPLVARYAPSACIAIAQARLERSALSLQRLLDELEATPLELPDAELRDWDTPEDRAADEPSGPARE